MDWEEYFPDSYALFCAVEQRLLADKDGINYVNARYKLFSQAESAWLYDVRFSYQDKAIVITHQQGEVILAPQELDYLKIRPFYFASCIGFKAFVLYAHAK